MTYVAEPTINDRMGRVDDRPAEMLRSIFGIFDVAGIRYCVPHGHLDLPNCVDSDVDLIIDGEMLPRQVAGLLERHASDIGAHIVQWLDDGAHFVVLSDTRTSGAPQFLQLHITSNFEQSNRIFYNGKRILDTRRRRDPLWIPAPDIEFGCTLCNRIAKGSLDDQRGQRLSELYDQSPLRCEREVAEFFGVESAVAIVHAAQSGNWTPVREMLPGLQAELLAKTARQDRIGMVTRALAGWKRRLGRWFNPPCGLHVVFLGPDGVGKSTILAGVQEHMLPAFLGSEYHTFAPSLLPAKMQQKDSPHAKPPRGKIASFYKAAWWLVCYTLGYFVAIHPGRARSALVLNHRYLLDAIVDRKRYRYSGPVWMLKAIARVSPKADVVILLNAPPEVIHPRKREVPFEETARQCREYLAVVENLPNGYVVDASVSIEQTTAMVDTIILRCLRQRIERRFKPVCEQFS